MYYIYNNKLIKYMQQKLKEEFTFSSFSRLKVTTEHYFEQLMVEGLAVTSSPTGGNQHLIQSSTLTTKPSRPCHCPGKLSRCPVLLFETVMY